MGAATFTVTGTVMMRIASSLAAVLFLPLLACDDAVAPSSRLSEVLDASVLPAAESPYASLVVTLDQPGAVQVTYWRAVDDGALQLTVEAQVREHEIFLPRLHPSSEYLFEVRSLAQSGRLGPAVSGAFATAELPAEVAALQFTAEGVSSDSLFLIEVMLSNNGFGGGAIIVDAEGRVVWYWKGQGGMLMGSTRRANGNFVFHDAGRLVELTPGRRIVAELPNASPATPYGTIHHDVTVSPNNTLYFIAQDVRPYADTMLVGEAVWEWNPETGSTAKRWSVFDFFSWPEDAGPESVLNNWMHMNSLTVGARGNVLFSARSMDQVVSISPDFSRVEWRLGGPNASIPLSGDLQFSGQHNISEVAADRILIWDNGRRRPADSYSRGLELQIDPVSRTAAKIGEFRGSPDALQPVVGGAFRLANGNTLITYGFGGGDRIDIFEIATGGEAQWHLTAPAAIERIYKARALESVAGERKVPRP